MRTRIVVGTALALAAVALCPVAIGQEELWQRLLSANDAEKTAWINAHLARGMPPNEAFGDLILNRSAITLPLIEAKIEEVLRSPSPSECFTETSVEPKKFVHRAALAITEAGDVQSLKEARKLMNIDEEQFGWVVERTLLQARTYRNSFIVAYQGLELNDPRVNRRVLAWAREELADSAPPNRNFGSREPEPKPESSIKETRRFWAEAMVSRYGGVPTERDWISDPFVVSLEPAQAAALHNPVIRAAFTAIERRSARQ